MCKNVILVFVIMLLTLHSISQQAGADSDFKPALLVIDVQKQYLPMMSAADQEKAVDMMNWSIWLFRKHEFPIVRIYHTNTEWGPEPGSEGFAFHDSLKVSPDDPMIIKTYGSAFNKTELDSLLRSQHINVLFMCGLSSTGCVMATYFDAANYEYDRFLIRDAMLGPDAGHTDNVEEMFDAISINTVDYMIRLAEK